MFPLRTKGNCFSLIFSSASVSASASSQWSLSDHNFFVFPDRSIIFGMWVHEHKTVCQGPTKAIMVRDAPPYGHVPTYQISLTYLERQKRYGPDKKILFKKQLFDLEVKVPRRLLRYATHRLSNDCFLNSIIQLMCNLLLYRWPH
jgi:hypothetical protein